MTDEYQIEVYKREDGSFPFIDWEKKLPVRERAIIAARLGRLRKGNFGDCKSIKGAHGLFELRVHLGPGYRIYYGLIGKKVVLLLFGGEKGSQDRDLMKAQAFWKDYHS